MAGNLFVLPKQVPIVGGSVSANALANFYQTGTTTRQNTYTDIDLTVAHANPVVAGPDGVFEPIYFDPALPNYRLTLTDEDSNLIYQIDDIPASQAGSDLTLEGSAPFLDFVETDAAANNGVWRLQVNSEQLLLQLGNDAKSSFTTILSIDRTANTGDSIDFTPTALTFGGDSVATRSSGTFSPTPTGVTSPSGSIAYAIDGNLCTLRSTVLVGGTSNSTAFTFTGLPAAATPASQVAKITTVADNGIGNLYPALATVQTDGEVVFSIDSPFSATGFTASGVKGLPLGWSLTYPLS